MNNNRAFSLKKYYLVFTVMFVIVSAGVLCYYYMNGRTLICSIDGWQQHYKALVYYGKYLRQIIRTVFSEHRLVIPAWDFTIAEGSDVVNTFHYYVMGDPLNLLSVLVPSRYTYILFDLLIVLREYLAGIAFSVMCFEIGRAHV